MTDEATTIERPTRRRVCEHGAPLGACDLPECPDFAGHRCLTIPCPKVGCLNSRPMPPPPEEAFKEQLREVREAERSNPNPADFPPEAVSIWEETQRLAARESNSSAMQGAMFFRDENDDPVNTTEPWEFRPPQAHPDLHHDEPIVIGTGDGARLMWRQATPMHTGGARYRKKTPRSHVKRMTERDAAEVARRLAEAGVSSLTQWVLSLDAEGYTNAEIADTCNLTIDGVKSRLKKARGRMARRAESAG